ncbi:MAG: aminopeptidase P family protein [Clostridium sp.]|nr:aminopeptidase P family protein [Clostridium sp.]
MKEHINERVRTLRTYMKEHGLCAFIFPSTDPHCGEYIPDHWKSREWISGFNGSAGTAVVTLDDAALWTDSRYFLAAEEQLEGTPFQLMKDRLPETPSITQWLAQVLPAGSIVGMDAGVNTIDSVFRTESELTPNGIRLETGLDPAGELWAGRPTLPENPVEIHPLRFAGKSVTDKLSDIREEMQRHKADGLIVSQLDEIAWTLNLRGTDVHCNPVFVSYLFITKNTCTLYINKVKITTEVEAYLAENNINLRTYEAITEDLSRFEGDCVLCDRSTVNLRLYHSLPENCSVHEGQSPIALMKAVKSPEEIEGYRRAMERDGVAMVKFLKWLRPAVEAGGQTEMSIDRKLTALRAEQSLYRDISFDTIAGYGPHGAIVHYEATPKTDTELRPEGLLLLDSGAQYQDGTTDITRTIALGPVTEEERHDYTLVLKGHIRLARAKFPEGCSGTQLDVCARYAMWQEGINFLHGTGHGVGSYLNVHEGPHQIRMNYMPAPLRAGMTVTNEPGIYRTGRHGVRIENTQLIVPFRQGDFGAFLQFEPLTLCPIDTTPIDFDMLDKEEVAWLDEYHRTVYKRLAPLLDEEHRQWLEQVITRSNN